MPRRNRGSIQYRPSESDLAGLKAPLGTLLTGPPQNTMPQLSRLLSKARPPLIVAVGDVVSRETLAASIPVDLRIVDMKTLRMSTESTEYPAKRRFITKNPAGVITRAAWDTIKDALVARDALIVVEGEEDLLTLPCILESPDGSLVLYGQPKEGLVVVTVSKEKKSEVRTILNKMARE